MTTRLEVSVLGETPAVKHGRVLHGVFDEEVGRLGREVRFTTAR